MNQDIRDFAANLLRKDTDENMRTVYQKGLNLSPLSIQIINHDGKIIFQNQAYQRLFKESSDRQEKICTNTTAVYMIFESGDFEQIGIEQADLDIKDLAEMVNSENEQKKVLGLIEISNIILVDAVRISYFERQKHTGIYIIDADTMTVLYENPIAQQYSEVNRIGKPCFSIHGNNSMCKSCPLRSPNHTSLVNRSDHNMIFSVEAVADEWQGKPAYIIVVRKHKEMEGSADDEKMMQRMLRALQRAIGVYTEINMKTGEYRNSNRGRFSFFSGNNSGNYAEEFEKLCQNKIAEEDLPEMRAKLSWEALNHIISDSDGPEELSVRYRVKNSDPTIIMESKAVFIRDELPHYVVLIANDVTEETENLANALEASNAASYAKTKFLENMSHDIRTPMNAILGMTEMSEGHFDDKETMETNIHVIRDSSKQLMSIINDVLDMAKIESGTIFFAEKPYNLRDALSAIMAPHQALAIKNNQNFIIDMGEIQSPYVIGDKAKLGRVLGNLLGNAIKFTPEGGTITVVIRELQSWNDSLMNLQFTIKDDGQGIAEDQISKIFEPFYRGDAAKATYVEGTGLGLAIAQNIVQARGGRIFVENVKEGGVSFTFDLPFRLNPDKMTQQEENENVFGQNALDTLGMQVLLVEDNEINILVMKKILHAWGIIVEVAKNGREAYEMFYNSVDGMYSLILMDVRMPVMDGYEATRAIRASDHPQAREIPIIALTANAFTEDISKSISAGMDYHLSKPVDVKELKKIIRLLNEQRWSN